MQMPFKSDTTLKVLHLIWEGLCHTQCKGCFDGVLDACCLG